MCAAGRAFVAASVLSLVWVGANVADEQRLPRTQLAKLGKAASALVEVGGGQGQAFGQGPAYGSAFCVHPSGLFVTTEHVIHPPNRFGGNPQGAEGPITLVVNPGQKTEKSYAVRVVRVDKELDLALLRADGVRNFPALSLGDDENLKELMDVVAFGFPYGPEMAGARVGQPAQTGRREYPSVSVNAGNVTALRRKNGSLDRIQFDATLNPGNSGGPVLDKGGKVVGVVVSMAVAQHLGRTGISYGIPVSHLTRFLARPDVEFDPPIIRPANVYKPVLFEAEVLPIIPSAARLTVDLILKPAGGKERSYRLKASGTTYRATAVPLPPPPRPWRLRLLAQFEDGLLNATAADRAFKVGDRPVQLSEVRGLQLKPGPRVVLYDGKVIEGPLSGLDRVPVQLGDQSMPVNLAKAAEVKFGPAVDTDQVWYTLRVRQGDREVFRETESLVLDGLLPTPTATAGLTGIKRPTLEGKVSVRKLSAPVADVAVGGAGRFLVLHLPSRHKLAVFDVNTAEVVGYIPVKDHSARFAAGSQSVVVLLPGAGTMERWSLKTLERDIATPLPVKGVIMSVAMGSASKGPLLVHWAAGTQALDRASFALVDVERMRLIEGDIKVYPALGSTSRDIAHLRASNNGKVFGLWCTSHSPSGLGVITASDAGVHSAYDHTDAGYVVPSPDGKLLYTRFGRCSPQVSLTERTAFRGGPGLPACHGDYYLALPPVANPWQGRARPFPSRPGAPQPSRPPAGKADAITVRALTNDKAIATFSDLDLPGPGEAGINHNLTFDKRIHLIPEARLIITIPVSNDRLILHGYGG